MIATVIAMIAAVFAMTATVVTMTAAVIAMTAAVVAMTVTVIAMTVTVIAMTAAVITITALIHNLKCKIDEKGPIMADIQPVFRFLTDILSHLVKINTFHFSALATFKIEITNTFRTVFGEYKG